jgi:outer membrane receptor protein involved in Fe transport
MVVGCAGSAQAAPVLVRFRIEPKPYAEALLDLAQQANITLVGASACAGYSRSGVAASLTVEQALNRVLAGAPCTWKEIAPNTIQVSAAPRAEAKPVVVPPAVSELLVTATKRVRNPRQLAVAITAVSGSELYPSGASDAAEGAARLSMLSTNLGPARDKLLLRGLSDGAYTGRARSTVATYLDDIPLNYNAPDPDLRLADVQRVEIARGPQGALYGAGFLSGIYRIISNKPNLHEMSAEASLTAALTDRGAPSGAVEGYVNLPIREDRLGLRITAYDQIDGGYLDDVRLGKRDANRTERKGGRISLLIEPADDWTILLTATDQHLRSDDTQYTTEGLGLTRDNRIREPHTNDISLWTAQVRRSWSWGELTSSTGVVEHAYGSLYDATPSQDEFTRDAVTSAYFERTSTTMLVEDLYLTSRGTGPFQWLVGLYGASTREHSPTAFIAHPAAGPDETAYSDNRHDQIDEVAAYGEASYAFPYGWTLAVGGRVFTISTHTRSHVESEIESFQPRELDRSARFSSFAPKISLQHELPGGNLVYAVYSEGYRAGGFNSGGPQPLPEVQAIYAPDRLRNYEVGLKLQGFDKRLSINSAVYYDRWTDIQTDQYRESGIPYTTNAGDADVRGLETEIGYRADNGFSFEVNGRYTQTKTSNPNLNFLSVLIQGLPNAPPFSGGAFVSYERPLANGWQVRLAGETAYVGRSHVVFSTGFPEMGGYVRTKLLVELRHGSKGAQVFLTNPTNAFSDTFAFGNQFNPSQARQITPQRPTTLGVTLYAAY